MSSWQAELLLELDQLTLRYRQQLYTLYVHLCYIFKVSFRCGRFELLSYKKITTATHTHTPWLTIDYYFRHVEKPTILQTESAYHDADEFSSSIHKILSFSMVFTIRLGQRLGSCNISVSVSSRTKFPTSRSRRHASRVSSRSRVKRSRTHPWLVYSLWIYYAKLQDYQIRKEANSKRHG